MSEDDNKPEESAEDDWAAALAEQAETEGDGETVNPDDIFNTNQNAKPADDLFKPFADSSNKTGTKNDIDMVLDIPVQLTVELGRTKIPIKNILQLAQGSVIELDGYAGEPMDVLVNGFLIAQGEVVVVNDKFGIRLTDIITPSERLRKLNR